MSTTAYHLLNAIGQPVSSRDAGHKMIRSVQVPHGPWILRKITKAGKALIQNEVEERIVLQDLVSLLRPGQSVQPDELSQARYGRVLNGVNAPGPFSIPPLSPAAPQPVVKHPMNQILDLIAALQ